MRVVVLRVFRGYEFAGWKARFLVDEYDLECLGLLWLPDGYFPLGDEGFSKADCENLERIERLGLRR